MPQAAPLEDEKILVREERFKLPNATEYLLCGLYRFAAQR
jgi:hypothetical protein